MSTQFSQFNVTGADYLPFRVKVMCLKNIFSAHSHMHVCKFVIFGILLYLGNRSVRL